MHTFSVKITLLTNLSSGQIIHLTSNERNEMRPAWLSVGEVLGEKMQA